jgi:NADP-dependent 3-hydroxy acid dehydrogenase YdfG
MDPPYPSITSIWHTGAYSAIESSTATGKVVVVTGASSGIGRATALAFAKSGAKHLALIARRSQLLDETKALAEEEQPGIKVTTHALSVKDLGALKTAAAAIGSWDVLVLNAGRIMKPTTVEEADAELWWDVLEVGKSRFQCLLQHN